MKFWMGSGTEHKPALHCENEKSSKPSYRQPPPSAGKRFTTELRPAASPLDYASAISPIRTFGPVNRLSR